MFPTTMFPRHHVPATPCARGTLSPGTRPRRGETMTETTSEHALHGTVALVTGASSGIGEATAAMLAARGAAVALAARRKDRLEKLAADIRSLGGTAVVLESDVTDERQAI